MVKRTGSSITWMKEHFDDHYVKMAQREGYRSRACYKLLEIQEKDRLIKPGMSVVDLGSAPGGWSQVAAMLVGHHGQVLASDILEMDTIAGVEFIQGDFTDEAVANELMAFLGNQKADLVISDMAPNMSGMRDVDQPQSMYLCELALDMASLVLRPGGGFVTKIFQGEGFEEYMRLLRERFSKVVTRKPAASRPRSREVYLVATGLRG
ncbi:23S rRNA (uridine(2552)-2'-O)-methyltransferase RlmE [Zhongshania aliphaticivorans]|uniref:23S rRNA (uridine(2552)-2'-O)-methyltransferase RlmE n=1 Tax=Zhongshania aliphaticivorans TaxID=1470434 RepID=UPI001330B9A7|nr:23S rRNA (uridine(2552)-2'-O)-methyltransferase RlmE [Zhongshania aliphaticivorans]